jgi:hypothetical protein
MDADKCKSWELLRSHSSPKNPITNRKIKINGPTYKSLDKECNDHKFYDMNSVCVKWLRDNHPNLYRQLQDKNAIVDSINDDYYYTVEFRKQIKKAVKTYFTKAIVRDGNDMCMTGNRSMLKFIKDPQLIGYGSYGNVYKAGVPNSDVSVAIKEGRLLAEEFKEALKGKYPREYLYNSLVNTLVTTKVCPNYCYTYAIYYCNRCTVKGAAGPTQCSETVVELFDHTLNGLTDLSDKVVSSILFQLLFAVASIQLMYGLSLIHI